MRWSKKNRVQLKLKLLRPQAQRLSPRRRNRAKLPAPRRPQRKRLQRKKSKRSNLLDCGLRKMPVWLGLDRGLSERGRIVDSPGSWTGKLRVGLCSHSAQHWFHGSRSACRAVWFDLGEVDKVGRTDRQMHRCVSRKTNELHEPEWLPAPGNSAVLQDPVTRDSCGAR